jgi:hypothetical protein
LPALAHEVVGILAVGQEKRNAAFLPSAETGRAFSSARHAAAARAVAVEAKDHAIALPEELLHVRGCRRCPKRCDRVLDAVLRERDDVHVAFDDDDRAAVAYRAAREERARRARVPSRNNGVSGRVQVLRLAVAEYAPAEADHLAAANRGSGNMIRSRKRS